VTIDPSTHSFEPFSPTEAIHSPNWKVVILIATIYMIHANDGYSVLTYQLLYCALRGLFGDASDVVRGRRYTRRLLLLEFVRRFWMQIVGMVATHSEL
jgi:hypothetical protein